MSILDIVDLKVWDTRRNHQIIKGLCFGLNKGECLAIVGESGSGKSVTCKAIMGLNKPWLKTTGTINFEDNDLLKYSSEQFRKIRGKKIGMVLQDGMSAFDPSCVIAVHLRETLKEHLSYDKGTADRAMIAAMESVMLRDPKGILKKYPHQLSGGMLQRVMIALALALKPDILIADEPTTALDSITQYEVIEQFVELRNKIGVSMIFVSHDLGAVKKIADKIIVMRQGIKVEDGTRESIFHNPQHPYTQYLVQTRMAFGEKFRRTMEG